jgi:hypothetical protein
VAVLFLIRALMQTHPRRVMGVAEPARCGLGGDGRAIRRSRSGSYQQIARWQVNIGSSVWHQRRSAKVVAAPGISVTKHRGARLGKQRLEHQALRYHPRQATRI